MTKLVPCEPFEAECWDDNEKYKAKGTVYGFINGLPIVEWYGTHYYSTYLHYKKIEPEFIPLDSTDEIPAWCVNREFDRAGLTLTGVSKYPTYRFLCKKVGGEKITVTLDEAARQKLAITSACGHTFKFYKEKK